MSVLHRLTQRGDTIIEVMIAVTLASSVLVISYATMNHNTNTLQSNQERTEASKLLQGQIETIRYMYNTSPATLAAANSNFCLAADGTTPVINGGSPHGNLVADNWVDYPAVCDVGMNNRYHIGVTTSDHEKYRFYIRWDRVGSGTRDEIVMVYKVK